MTIMAMAVLMALMCTMTLATRLTTSQRALPTLTQCAHEALQRVPVSGGVVSNIAGLDRIFVIHNDKYTDRRKELDAIASSQNMGLNWLSGFQKSLLTRADEDCLFGSQSTEMKVKHLCERVIAETKHAIDNPPPPSVASSLLNKRRQFIVEAVHRGLTETLDNLGEVPASAVHKGAHANTWSQYSLYHHMLAKTDWDLVLLMVDDARVQVAGKDGKHVKALRELVEEQVKCARARASLPDIVHLGYYDGAYLLSRAGAHKLISLLSADRERAHGSAQLGLSVDYMMEAVEGSCHEFPGDYGQKLCDWVAHPSSPLSQHPLDVWHNTPVLIGDYAHNTGPDHERLTRPPRPVAAPALSFAQTSEDISSQCPRLGRTSPAHLIGQFCVTGLPMLQLPTATLDMFTKTR